MKKKVVFLYMQIICKNKKNIPNKKKFKKILNTISIIFNLNFRITIRIVSIQEMINLNMKYRRINRPTNILSFNLKNNFFKFLDIVGDIVICKYIIEKEAKNLGKSLESHWVHIFLHGILHLIGYKHNNKKKFKIMKNMEIKLMKIFNYDNPYDYYLK